MASAQWANPQPTQTTRDNNGNPVQYDSQGRPIERSLDNNGNPTPSTQVRSQQTQQNASNCRVFLPTPAGVKEYYYRGFCPDGLGTGYQKAQVFSQSGGQPYLVETTFLRGYPTGKITVDNGSSYAMHGDILPDGSISGMNTRADGAWQLGVFKNGLFTEGLVQKLNQPTEFVVDGRPASEAEYKARQVATADVPPTDRSSISEPPCFMERPFIKQGNRLTGQYPGRCINDRYNGKAVLNLYDHLDKYGDPLIFTVNYKDGKPFGTAMLDSGNGAIIFTGTLKNWVPWYGYTQVFDENNRPKRFGLINSKDVPYAQIGRIPTFTPYEPPTELATSTKPASKKGGCDAERPTDRYFVTGDYPGTCQNGRYTGTAELTLTPKDASLPTIKVKASFQNGYLSGPVTAKYPQLGITYKGTFDGWRPIDGVSEQPTGNRNFVVKEYRGGVEVSSRTEYRPPSELELALIGAAGQIGQNLGTKLGREIDGSAGHDRAIKRQAEAEQLRQQDIARANDITRQARTTAGQQVRDEQIAQQRARDQAQADWQRQSDATIEDARRKALAGLDRDGNPLPAPPADVARNDPSPVFGGTTNAPVFGGNANSQGDPPVITTRPPELPAPHPVALPDPVRGIEPLPPAIRAPVQVASLPDPITPQPNGVPPPLAPPVQLGNQSDTLGSGPAPSNSVVPQPSQPAENVASRPSATPTSTGSTNGTSPALPNTQPQRPTPQTLSAPSILEPNYQGELSQPVTLKWTRITGATRYWVTVRNVQTGATAFDSQFVTGTTKELPILSQGTQYKWDISACDAVGCGRESPDSYFRTVGVGTNTTPQDRTFGFTSDDTRWMQSLPIELQVQVLRLTGAQVQAYKDRGEWPRFKQVVTQAAGEMRNAEIEEQREKLAIWERAWSQSQRVLIEGSLWLIPVERIAVAAYDMSKVVRGARIVVETPRGVGATGIIGEVWLKTLGGRSQVGFQTTRGMRYVDQVVGRAGHESKVGYQSLGGDIPEQIAKDQLLLVRELDTITWHFFRSPTTGQIGPSAPLRQALQKAGIQIIEHPNP